MKNKITVLKSILNIGTIILFIASLCLFNLNGISSYAKCAIVLVIGLTELLISSYICKEHRLAMEEKMSYLFGMSSIFITYIYVGLSGLISFSNNNIFVLTIFILLSILFGISYLRYKYKFLIYMAICSLLIGLISIFDIVNIDGIFFYTFVTLLLIILSNYSKSKIFDIISIIWNFIMCAIYIKSNITFVMGLLYLLNIVNLLNISVKNNKMQMISLVSSILATAVFSLNFQKAEIALLIIPMVLSALELFIHLKDAFYGSNEKIFKIIVNIIYGILYIFLINSKGTIFVIFTCAMILLVISLVLTFIYKDKYEVDILPYKLIITTGIFLNLLFNYINVSSIYSWICLNIITLLLMYFSKNKKLSKKFEVMLGIEVILSMVISDKYFMNQGIYAMYLIIIYSIDLLVVMLNNSFKSENIDKISSILLIIFMLDVLSKIGMSNLYLFIIVSCILMMLLILNKEEMYYSMILIPTLLLVLSSFIIEVIGYVDISYVMIELLFSLGMILFANIVIGEEKRLSFITTMLYISMGFILLISHTLITELVVLTQALSIILFSMKDKKYRSLYIEGIVFVVITLLIILLSINNIPGIFYLIVIGLIIVIVVPIIILNSLKDDNKKE
ncbi:MAG TPA: hypothetical protein PKG93_02950 [Bacilli bacterium]|nr:hypothetical protein [Bacilli bacterium]